MNNYRKFYVFYLIEGLCRLTTISPKAELKRYFLRYYILTGAMLQFLRKSVCNCRNRFSGSWIPSKNGVVQTAVWYNGVCIRVVLNVS